jgi:hypothetical protein
MAQRKRSHIVNSQRLHRVARVLVESATLGDAAAAAKHGISMATIGRYRSFLESGEGPAALKLSELVDQKQKLLDGDFSVYIRAALNGHLDFLLRAAGQLDPTDPKAVRASVGAIKYLGDRFESFTLLDARLAGLPPVQPVAPKAIKAA